LGWGWRGGKGMERELGLRGAEVEGSLWKIGARVGEGRAVGCCGGWPWETNERSPPAWLGSAARLAVEGAGPSP